MDDGIGLAEALLGLEGFRCSTSPRGSKSWSSRSSRRLRWWAVRTAACVARPRGRIPIDIRGLTCFGARHGVCGSRAGDAAPTPIATSGPGPSTPITSTPRRCSPGGPGAEACRQYGEEARPVSRVAAEFGRVLGGR